MKHYYLSGLFFLSILFSTGCNKTPHSLVTAARKPLAPNTWQIDDSIYTTHRIDSLTDYTVVYGNTISGTQSEVAIYGINQVTAPSVAAIGYRQIQIQSYSRTYRFQITYVSTDSTKGVITYTANGRKLSVNVPDVWLYSPMSNYNSKVQFSCNLTGL